MAPPEAYFITWTTYAARLHGQQGGSVDHAREGHGTTRINHSPGLLAQRTSRLSEPPFLLDAPARATVEQSIRDVAVHNDWPLLALAVRSNHVHILIRSNESPEQVMTSCKSWATRALREAGRLDGRSKVWTRHGSTRWINNAKDLAQAHTYITEYQEGERAQARYTPKDA
jgi:REP element-mobilizing transposase RayT